MKRHPDCYLAENEERGLRNRLGRHAVLLHAEDCCGIDP
jgi:hypothetical protein